MGVFHGVFQLVRREVARGGTHTEVVSGETSGDYLQAFLLGTREAISAKGRDCITVTVDDVTPFSVGALIALYDRAVGFYASLVGINAYHQPGVEAGKKAASSILAVKAKIVAALTEKEASVDEIAREINLENEKEIVFKLLIHLASNPSTGVASSGAGFDKKFRKTK